MATNININDEVYVCRSRLPSIVNNAQAFYKTRVVERENRSVRVLQPDGHNSDLIATKFVHHRVGVAIIEFGDFHSEQTLLDPLAKTVTQYCRLLFGDDDLVRFFKVRTDAELNNICETSQLNAFEHVVFMGHGDKMGNLCNKISKISAGRLIEILEQNNPRAWDFTFLCCYFGRNSFGQVFSQSRICKSLVAPYNSIHGAVSAQFIQTYLVKLQLAGDTTTVAHRNASKSTPAGSKFRLWRDGNRSA